MHDLIDYRDMWADIGIHIIKPRQGGTKDKDPERSAVAQSELIADQMVSICAELGARTVIWDTLTGTARHVLDELAQSGLHSGQNTKKYRVIIDGKPVSERMPPAMQDYGWSQVHLRNAVRNRMLFDPERNYHLIHVMHQETAKKPLGRDPETKQQTYQPLLHGPNGGGPGSVETFGTEYQASNRIYVEGEGTKARRYVQLRQFTDQNHVPYACRTNVGGNIPDKLEIPTDFAAAVATRKKILDAMGIDTERPDRTGYYSGVEWGVMGCGKTRWASTFLGLPNALPAVYVAADGDSEYLRSFWNELKQGDK